MERLERWFRIRAAGSTVRREVVAGLVTFTTLSYILFVQPAILSNPVVGMDAGGVLFATCVASAFACFLMGFWANHPFALAPAMGHNVFFAFTVCGALGYAWQEALAANLIAGLLFLALAPSGVREKVMDAVPVPIRAGIAAGIGLLIAHLGLQWGNLVVDDPVVLVGLGDLADPVALLSLFGLLLLLVLYVRRVPGAILIGVVGTALVGWAASRAFSLETPLVELAGIVGEPPSPASTAFGLDFAGLFSRPLGDWLGVLAVFLFLDLFDTVGSLLALGRQADLLEDGRLPRARAALASDAAGTVVGACLGTSTVTSYVESASGIASGGRTGLVAVVCGVCFLAALFFQPLFEFIGAGVVVQTDPVVLRYPVVAPVLILVGALMFGALTDVRWGDPVHAVPAFLTAILMPLTFSITDGIAIGFVSYSVLSFATRRSAPVLVHVLAALFVLRSVFLT